MSEQFFEHNGKYYNANYITRIEPIRGRDIFFIVVSFVNGDLEKFEGFETEKECDEFINQTIFKNTVISEKL